eukprot:5852297-Prymnesium_polylepis.1
MLTSPDTPGDAGAGELGAIGADSGGRAPPVRGARVCERVARLQPQELPRNHASALKAVGLCLVRSQPHHRAVRRLPWRGV